CCARSRTRTRMRSSASPTRPIPSWPASRPRKWDSTRSSSTPRSAP
ncbi:MAG: hypothetical protein AVDCRST_MAG51-3478, partial [uncultured Ramlibacter sp.]